MVGEEGEREAVFVAEIGWEAAAGSGPGRAYGVVGEEGEREAVFVAEIEAAAG